ncbi:hypothetical protein ATANTOWER_023400 [Ataeniobius toweri]|uniref:Uncharacterized protein n=1 Tax=Ataeniobius toweri TaxID=208326 RepID=A0ABU7BXK1_9TELE|nr:hypothetical protein [Ataeniobius toweri]
MQREEGSCKEGSWSFSLAERQCTFWTGSRSSQREPTHGWGRHANSMQKDPRPGFEARTFLLQGNSAANGATM